MCKKYLQAYLPTYKLTECHDGEGHKVWQWSWDMAFFFKSP